MTGGGAAFQPPPPPPEKATLVNGRLLAPASAPARIKRVIAAANRLVEKPYVYGGGHRPYRRSQVSTAATTAPASCPMRSTADASCAPPLADRRADELGPVRPGHLDHGVRAGGHAYLVVAGYRFDTSMHDLTRRRPADRPALEQDAPPPAPLPSMARTPPVTEPA